MPTGRKVAQTALREPMRTAGWQARAAGWFTREITSGYLGVLALSAAVERTAAGAAAVFFQVGIRDDETEKLVARLMGAKDDGYRSRTATIPIGYVMPDRSYREWVINESNASEVATEMARAVQQFAIAHLDTLCRDSEALIDAARGSGASSVATGGCRIAVLLARHRSVEDAEEFIAGRLSAIGERQDPAADLERKTAAALREWLAK